jgi:hypothetical protein
MGETGVAFGAKRRRPKKGRGRQTITREASHRDIIRAPTCLKSGRQVECFPIDPAPNWRLHGSPSMLGFAESTKNQPAPPEKAELSG